MDSNIFLYGKPKPPNPLQSLIYVHLLTRLLSTAATGYIGGTVLDALVTRHPEYSITALLRTVPDGFAARYPNVRIVRGSFDDTQLIADTAAENDIVIRK